MPREHYPLYQSELKLGGIERNGPYVSLTFENGCYMVRRHPDHPAGHKVRGARTLRAARMLSSTLRNEKPSA